MAIIKFIAEYTDGLYNYLALETGANLRMTATCSEPECTTVPDCTLYDAEGAEDIMPFCKRHISMLDIDSELNWSKVELDEDETPATIVLAWMTQHPSFFIEKATEYDPEQSYNF